MTRCLGILWFVGLSTLLAAPSLVRGETDAAPRDNSLPAATDETRPDDGQGETPRGFLEIVLAGGWTGLLIVLLLVGLSIGATAFCVEHWLTVRQDILIPPELPSAVTAQLASGAVTAADQICQAQPSILAVVLRAGLAEVEGGWAAVEKAMEDAMAGQSARLLRKIEYLSVIGNIAPMVGLLGTVIGMIFAFGEVADSQGAARAAELASGIYQALVTTVGGLLVAIPSLGAYALFRNRVDQLIAETAYTAMTVTRPLKRLLTRQRSPSSEPRGSEARKASAAPPPPPR